MNSVEHNQHSANIYCGPDLNMFRPERSRSGGYNNRHRNIYSAGKQ